MMGVSRLLVAIFGLLSITAVNQHWFDVASLEAARGIKAIGAIGAANIRADIGSSCWAASICTGKKRQRACKPGSVHP